MSQEVKDRIRKLLNLANDDGAMDGEIDNALRFARRLMLQHSISEEDLDKPQNPHEIAADEEYSQVSAYTVGGKLSTWEVSLANAVVSLVGSIKYYRRHSTEVKTPAGTLAFDLNGKPRVAVPVVFYGPLNDCQEARELFEEWSQIIVSLARMKYGGALRGPGRSYAEGFAGVLGQKVRQIRQEERTQISLGQGVGIATDQASLVLSRTLDLMQAKKERADKWLREEVGIRLSAGSRSSGGHHHGDAYGAGRTDGARAGFGRKTQAKRLT